MAVGMQRCVRCNGRKKMYKINSAYSMTNCGGQEVDCPMCLGKGETVTPAIFAEQLKNKSKENIEKEKEKLLMKRKTKGD